MTGWAQNYDGLPPKTDPELDRPRIDMSSSKPQILLLMEETPDELLEDIYPEFLTALRTKFQTKDISYKSAKSLSLSQSQPAVILAVSGTITERRYRPLHDELVSFVKNDGGTLICCCQFSSFCRPPDLTTFMAKFNLPWKSGDYHRSTFVLNGAFKDRFGADRFGRLLPAYSMKALHVDKASSAAVIYGPDSASRTQSMVFPPSSVDQAQAPVVLERCGKGEVGYVGDVNPEDGTQELLLVMVENALRASMDEGVGS